MRITLVCPYSLDVAGGVGTHVLGLGRWLQGRGYSVAVVAPGRTFRADDLEVHLVAPSAPLPFNGSLARLSRNRWSYQKALKVVMNSDLTHVHEPLTPGLGFAAACASRRLVVTHHAHFQVPNLLGFVLRWRSRKLGVRRSIAVSQMAAQTSLLVTGQKPVIIPNGITLPTESKCKSSVLYIGRKSDSRKGYSTFKDAKLKARDLPWQEISDGRARREEVHRQMAQASVVYLPYLGGESFGMVIVEALAHGCSVVASDLPAFRDLLGDLGRLVPIGNSQEAISAIRDLLANPIDREAARRRATEFSWDVVGPRVVREYQRAALR